MRFAGRESWQVEHGSNPAVNTALFLRDTLALSVDAPPELPGLDPSVPVIVPVGVDRRAVTREWPSWWNEVLEFAGSEQAKDAHEAPVHPDSGALLTRPAVRAALIALQDLAATYEGRDLSARRPGAIPIGDVVRGVEARIGRHVRPFRLVITEVAVQGLVWERITDVHVIASERFLHDPARSAPALRAVVEELA